MPSAADTVLKKNIEDAHAALLSSVKDADEQEPVEVCKAHGKWKAVNKAIANGMAILLEVKSAEMESPPAATDSITFGKLTVHGPVAVVAVAVVYLLAKAHGLTP